MDELPIVEDAALEPMVDDWPHPDKFASEMLRRGLEADRGDLVRAIEFLGFDRLARYWRLDVADDGRFVEGASLERALERYRFDARLRDVTFDAIRAIEVFLRHRTLRYLQLSCGPTGYLDKANFQPMGRNAAERKREHGNLVGKCALAGRQLRSEYGEVPFRRTAEGDDDDKYPSFRGLAQTVGLLTTQCFFRYAQRGVQWRIAEPFNFGRGNLDPESIKPDLLAGWFFALAKVRNICAHHDVLWAQTLRVGFSCPRKHPGTKWDFLGRKDEPLNERGGRHAYGMLGVVSFLLDAIYPESPWWDELAGLLADAPDYILREMRFPEGWERAWFWGGRLEALAS